MDIFSIFTLCGGLAFFLYGMIVMSAGLEKISGGKLEKLLAQLTSSPLKGFLLGVGMTIAVQSSSAVSVMLVGFVNSGIMNLSQTIAITLGSNIGTTATSWILSLSGIQSTNFFLRLLKPESFSPILALIGVILLMTTKNNYSRRKPVGAFLIGFAILMFGMGLMSSSMAPLAHDPNFANILTLFQNPLLGLMVGLIVTAVIQSSAASVGMLQALSLTGSISYSVAAPIIAGQNIGTCITAMLSSIGVNTNAKKVAAMHIVFNITGAVAFILLYEFCIHFVNKLGMMANPFGIAIVHTIYNVVTVIVCFPLSKLLQRFVDKVIKDSDEDTEVILDERLLLTPSIAVAQCYKTTGTMARITRETLALSVRMLKQYNPKVAEVINKNEVLIDKYQDTLEAFLQKLSGKELSDEESNKVSQLILSISDFEKIADHAINILNIANKMHKKEWKLSPETIEELKRVVNAVKEVFDITVNAFVANDLASAYHIEPLEQVVDDIAYNAKKNHIKRVKKDKSHIRRGFVYAEVLNDLERISDHCSNIATNSIQAIYSSIPKHILKNSLKETANADIQPYIEEFKSKYGVEPIVIQN
ncbi:MAG: Na/Pi cotransporter family protein [Muribaculaceae bacterium]|nr:Na/Pi cotransporter family protein [Muribaculaceae bacterium]